jgi:hypothetical protein
LFVDYGGEVGGVASGLLVASLLLGLDSLDRGHIHVVEVLNVHQVVAGWREFVVRSSGGSREAEILEKLRWLHLVLIEHGDSSVVRAATNTATIVYSASFS